ncbi:hypothetical protein ACLOJK_034499, partial [Asimina triloba]
MVLHHLPMEHPWPPIASSSNPSAMVDHSAPDLDGSPHHQPPSDHPSSQRPWPLNSGSPLPTHHRPASSIEAPNQGDKGSKVRCSFLTKSAAAQANQAVHPWQSRQQRSIASNMGQRSPPAASTIRFKAASRTLLDRMAATKLIGADPHPRT